MKSRVSVPSSSLRYALSLGAAEQEAIADTLAQYAAMMAALDEIAAREGIRSDVVRLQ
jgi:hypothetical protein